MRCTRNKPQYVQSLQSHVFGGACCHLVVSRVSLHGLGFSSGCSIEPSLNVCVLQRKIEMAPSAILLIPEINKFLYLSHCVRKIEIGHVSFLPISLECQVWPSLHSLSLREMTRRNFVTHFKKKSMNVLSDPGSLAPSSVLDSKEVGKLGRMPQSI